MTAAVVSVALLAGALLAGLFVRRWKLPAAFGVIGVVSTAACALVGAVSGNWLPLFVAVIFDFVWVALIALSSIGVLFGKTAGAVRRLLGR